MADEPGYVIEARKALATFIPAFEQLTTQLIAYDSSDKELAGRVAVLSRLLHEMEQRAVAAETRCDELAAKATRNNRLERAARKLAETLDLLPQTMGEAGIVPGATKPAIALYGTYDWQNVMEAKFALQKELKTR